MLALFLYSIMWHRPDRSFRVIDSKTNWFWSGCETLILGGTCATVAYTIGAFVDGLLDDDE